MDEPGSNLVFSFMNLSATGPKIDLFFFIFFAIRGTYETRNIVGLQDQDMKAMI